MIIDNEYEKQHNLGPYTAKQGTVMTGAQAIIASLEAEGVDTVFGYPGGQAIKIYDALYDSKKIRHILSRHEQGSAHEADGYARAVLFFKARLRGRCAHCRRFERRKDTINGTDFDQRLPSWRGLPL